jgi:hypothetical protein
VEKLYVGDIFSTCNPPHTLITILDGLGLCVLYSDKRLPTSVASSLMLLSRLRTSAANTSDVASGKQQLNLKVISLRNWQRGRRGGQSLGKMEVTKVETIEDGKTV